MARKSPPDPKIEAGFSRREGRQRYALAELTP
jgi:hypothetical protein